MGFYGTPHKQASRNHQNVEDYLLKSGALKIDPIDRGKKSCQKLLLGNIRDDSENPEVVRWVPAVTALEGWNSMESEPAFST